MYTSSQRVDDESSELLPDFDAGLLGAVDNDEVADPTLPIEETGLKLRLIREYVEC